MSWKSPAREIDYGIEVAVWNSGTMDYDWVSYDKSYLIEMTLTEGIGGEYEIGRVESARLTIVCRKLETYIRDGNQIRIWYKAPGSSVKERLGLYFAEKTTSHNGIYTIECYDRVREIDEEYKDIHKANSSELLWVLIVAGLERDWSSGPGFVAVDIPVPYADNTTKREILGDLAALRACSLVLDRSQKVRKIYIDRLGSKGHALDATDYSSIRRFGESAMPDNVILNMGKEGLEYVGGGGIFGKGNPETALLYDLPYASQRKANEMWANMGSSSLEAFTLEARGSLEYEIGDSLLVKMVDGSYFVSNIIHMVTRFKGGISQTISCPRRAAFGSKDKDLKMARKVKENSNTTRKVERVLDVRNERTVLSHSTAPYYQYGSGGEDEKNIRTSETKMIDGIISSLVKFNGELKEEKKNEDGDVFVVDYEKEKGLEINEDGLYHSIKDTDEEGEVKEEKVRIPKTYIFDYAPDDGGIETLSEDGLPSDDVGDIGDVWIVIPEVNERGD